MEQTSQERLERVDSLEDVTFEFFHVMTSEGGCAMQASWTTSLSGFLWNGLVATRPLAYIHATPEELTFGVGCGPVRVSRSRIRRDQVDEVYFRGEGIWTRGINVVVHGGGRAIFAPPDAGEMMDVMFQYGYPCTVPPSR